MDIEWTLDNGHPADVFEVWQRGDERRVWERVRATADEPAHRATADGALADLPDIGPLDMLRASRRLVEQLTGARWYVMQAAREAGASWQDIGAALGMTKQAAWAWYRDKIELQAKYAADFHDAERSRAVLADSDETVPPSVPRRRIPRF